MIFSLMKKKGEMKVKKKRMTIMEEERERRRKEGKVCKNIS